MFSLSHKALKQLYSVKPFSESDLTRYCSIGYKLGPAVAAAAAPTVPTEPRPAPNDPDLFGLRLDYINHRQLGDSIRRDGSDICRGWQRFIDLRLSTREGCHGYNSL